MLAMQIFPPATRCPMCVCRRKVDKAGKKCLSYLVCFSRRRPICIAWVGEWLNECWSLDEGIDEETTCLMRVRSRNEKERHGEQERKKERREERGEKKKKEAKRALSPQLLYGVEQRGSSRASSSSSPKAAAAFGESFELGPPRRRPRRPRIAAFPAAGFNSLLFRSLTRSARLDRPRLFLFLSFFLSLLFFSPKKHEVQLTRSSSIQRTKDRRTGDRPATGERLLRAGVVARCLRRGPDRVSEWVSVWVRESVVPLLRPLVPVRPKSRKTPDPLSGFSSMQTTKTTGKLQIHSFMPTREGDEN